MIYISTVSVWNTINVNKSPFSYLPCTSWYVKLSFNLKDLDLTIEELDFEF